MPRDRAADTLKQARKIRLNPSQVFQDFIGNGDQTDLYRFKLGAKSQFDLTLSNLRANANVEVYQIKGRLKQAIKQIGRIAFDDLSRRHIRRHLRRVGQSKRGGKRDEQISRALNSGVYFVRVYSNQVNGGTRYRLSLSAVSRLVSQPIDGAGDTIGVARQIAPDGANLIEQVGGADPVDFYRFNLSDRQKVTLSLTNLQADADLKLLDSAGEVLKSSARVGTVSEQIVRNLRAGTYYIQVVPKSGNTTTYTLTTAATDLTTTSLYSGNSLPKSQGWLDFQQFPLPENLSPVPIQVLPGNLANLFGPEVAQTSVLGGVRVNTEIFSMTPNEGYVGYSNYSPDFSSLNLGSLSGADSLDDIDVDFDLVNPAFPLLDDSVGYTLTFTLTVNSQTSNPNRAGFNLLLVNNAGRGLELGFKSDRIFAQTETFQESTTERTLLDTSDRITYTLDVVDNRYQLLADGVSLFSGSLRTYSFDPSASDPPLPLNPYTLPNFLFWGDNTDQGRADFTLGAVSLLT
jgi:hypothetical protein